MLSKSGQHGMFVSVDRDSSISSKLVLYPAGLHLNEALSKLDTLDPKIRNSHFGVVPTANGLALRVSPDALAKATAHINPDHAATLGPALGLDIKAHWMIHDFPRGSSRAEIHTSLADASGTWPGWTAQVVGKPASSQIRGRMHIIVGASTPPPKVPLVIDGLPCAIRPYTFPTIGKGREQLFQDPDSIELVFASPDAAPAARDDDDHDMEDASGDHPMPVPPDPEEDEYADIDEPAESQDDAPTPGPPAPRPAASSTTLDEACAIPIATTEDSAPADDHPRKLCRGSTDLAEPNARRRPNTSIKDIVANMQSRQAQFESEMKASNDQFASFATAVNARLDSVTAANSAAIDTVREATTALQGRVETIAGQITSIQTTMQEILARLPVAH